MRPWPVLVLLLVAPLVAASPPVTGTLLNGRVLAEDGYPVGGARIEVIEANGQRVVWSDPDGSYATFTFGSGPFRLNASAPYHSTVNLSLTAQAGGALKHDVHLRRAAWTLSGQVVHVHGDVPLAGAVVEVGMSHGSGCDPGTPCGDREAAGPQEVRPEFAGRNLTTAVQEDGRYAVALGSGWASVRITMDGFVPSGVGFVVFGNSTWNETLRPLPGLNAAIEGVVLESNGGPVAGARVWAEVGCVWVDPEGSPPRLCPIAAENVTDRGGRFRLVVERGYYKVQAALGDGSALVPVQLDDNETKTVELRLGSSQALPPEDAPTAKGDRVASPEAALLHPKGEAPPPRVTPGFAPLLGVAGLGAAAVIAARRKR